MDQLSFGIHGRRVLGRSKSGNGRRHEPSALFVCPLRSVRLVTPLFTAIIATLLVLHSTLSNSLHRVPWAIETAGWPQATVFPRSEV